MPLVPGQSAGKGLTAGEILVWGLQALFLAEQEKTQACTWHGPPVTSLARKQQDLVPN